MHTDKSTDSQVWYSRPLSQNPKAIQPLFFALIGAACWQAIPMASSDFWRVLAFGGAALFLGGLIGSFRFRQYRIAALALAVSLVSPPFWYFFLLGQAFGGWSLPFPCPLSVSEQLEIRPALYWLCLQIPLALLALGVCPWPVCVKAGAALLALGGLACFFASVTAQARREVAATPRITDAALAALYAGHDTAAQKRLEHQQIVLTGAISGEGDGILGWGGPHLMQGNVDCSIVIGEYAMQEGQTVTLLGTCLGKDKSGMIEVADCRVVP